MRLLVATSLLIACAIPAMAQSQPPASAMPPQARQPASEQEWTNFVRAKLARVARRTYIQGRHEGIVGFYSLRVTFTLHPDGSPTEIRISESSGNKTIDEIGLRIPSLAAPLPAFSPDMAKVPKEIVAPFGFDFRPAEPAPQTAP